MTNDLNILNIYTYNNVRACCQLWDGISSYLLQDCTWTIGGDFNMVEPCINTLNNYEMFIDEYK
jgi:hypothetical protein